jgi:hypothetical protein
MELDERQVRGCPTFDPSVPASREAAGRGNVLLTEAQGESLLTELITHVTGVTRCKTPGSVQDTLRRRHRPDVRSLRLPLAYSASPTR